MTARTLLVSHPDCGGHDTGPGHPESAARLDHLLGALEEAMPSFDGRLARVSARHATEVDLALVHPQAHVDRVRAACDRASDSNLRLNIDPDTVVSPGSWTAATAAAGSTLAAIDGLLEGSARNAFCAVRPPGHHATGDRAMGFCLFNNVAVGARYAQSKGLDRALILDWDVHHGNGTEAIFYDDPDIFYISMHQSPHYPGTGHSTQRGYGPGVGTTLNLPMPPNLPSDEYVSVLLSGLHNALSAFSPDVIFISAGFDAAYGDPLAGFTLRPEDYYNATQRIMEAAGACCGERVISVLEGGYNLEMLARCGLAHVQALAGVDLA